MSYEILSNSGKYWTCHQSAWADYLMLATTFGWAPEGAFFKEDEGGFGPHPSGSYLGNDWQKVTDQDARAFGAALHCAIGAVRAGAALTADQAAVLELFETNEDDESDLFGKPGETSQTPAIRHQEPTLDKESVYDPTHRRCFIVNLNLVMDLAEIAARGGFTIA